MLDAERLRHDARHRGVPAPVRDGQARPRRVPVELELEQDVPRVAPAAEQVHDVVALGRPPPDRFPEAGHVRGESLVAAEADRRHPRPPALDCQGSLRPPAARVRRHGPDGAEGSLVAEEVPEVQEHGERLEVEIARRAELDQLRYRGREGAASLVAEVVQGLQAVAVVLELELAAVPGPAREDPVRPSLPQRRVAAERAGRGARHDGAAVSFVDEQERLAGRRRDRHGVGLASCGGLGRSHEVERHRITRPSASRSRSGAARSAERACASAATPSPCGRGGSTCGRRSRSPRRSHRDAELDLFPGEGDVERAAEPVPDRESEAEVAVPVPLVLAVVDLVLGGADQDPAQGGTVREPDVGVPQLEGEHVIEEEDPVAAPRNVPKAKICVLSGPEWVAAN